MAASNNGQIGHFFGRKGTINFTTPYLIPFLSVLHQNKALHIFTRGGRFYTHKRSTLRSGIQMFFSCVLMIERQLINELKKIEFKEN